MWPFAKKEKQPEAKIDEEKLKQTIAAQLVFDPVTKQLKIKPKEPESPAKEQEPSPKIKLEPPPETKLECPTCKQVFQKRFSRNRFKCPHCRNWIYSLGDRPVTREDHDRLREKYYQDRYKERLRETMGEDLAKIGLTDEMLQRREQELLRKTGVLLQKSSVILSLFNETILKLKDLKEMEERYYNLALILRKGGEESFHILKAAAKTKLAALKKDGFKNVSILPYGMCEACRKLDGKVLSIEEALKTMPIPIRNCNNRSEDEKYSFCICSYEPEYDDEYWKNQP